jgi:hypothetical protein
MGAFSDVTSTSSSGVTPWKPPTLVNGKFASQSDLDAFNKAWQYNPGSGFRPGIGTGQLPYLGQAAETTGAARNWGVEQGLLDLNMFKGQSFGDFFKSDVLPIAAVAAPAVFGLAGAAGGGSAAASDAGMLPPPSGGASAFPGVSWQTPETGVLSEGGTGPFPGVTTQAPGSGVLTEGALSGAGIDTAATGTAATSGLDLGVAPTAPPFVTSPTGAMTGVTGAGVPTAFSSTSAAAPSYLGPMGDEFSAASGAENLSGGLAPPSSDAATLSAKSKGIFGTGISGGDALRFGLPSAALGAQLLGNRKGAIDTGPIEARQAFMEKQGQADITNARAGNLTPAQQAGIDKFKSDQMSAVKQYMVNSGQGVDSSSFLQLKANVDQQALAMSQGFLDTLMSQGLNELGLADSAEAQLVNIRLAEEQRRSNAWNQFMWSMGLLGAFGGTSRG